MSRSVLFAGAARWLPLSFGLFAAAAAHADVGVLDQVFFGNFAAPVFVTTVEGTATTSGPGYTATVTTSHSNEGAIPDFGSVKVHALSSITTLPGYVSGTDGNAQASITALSSYDLNSPNNLDFDALAGATFTLHAHVDGTITGGDNSYISADTVLLYNDADGHQVEASQLRLLRGQGPVSASYDISVRLGDLFSHDLIGTLVTSLSTAAWLANNDGMPSAEVDARNTSEIMGFAVYGADGAYLPGFNLTVDDFGSLPEYDTVLPGSGGNGVPEPASWALMILGFLGVGVAARTRRRAGEA